MHLYSLILPCFLLFHNMVDFSNRIGVQECYLNCLNHVVTNYVEMLEENNRIKLVYNTGTFDDKIHDLNLQFEASDMQDINNARIMVLQLVDSLLQNINSYDRIRPFLCPCPFTEDNIEISITFVNDCVYTYPRMGEVYQVIYSGGHLTYLAEDPIHPGETQTLREEPIALARRLTVNVPMGPQWRTCKNLSQ